MTGVPRKLQEAIPLVQSPQKHQQWLLREWERRQRTVHSLRVEFNQTQKFNSQGGLIRTFKGTAEFLRWPCGMTAGRICVQQIDPKTGKPLPDKQEECLAHGSTFYFKSPQEKMMLVIETGEPPSFDHGLLLSYHPCIIIPWWQNWTELWLARNPYMGAFIGIAPERVRETLRTEITKRDAWYTYANMWPQRGWPNVQFGYARVVYLNQVAHGTRHIPTHFPREVYCILNMTETTYDILRVEVNKPGSVNAADLAPPEVPKDWKVQRVFGDPWVNWRRWMGGPQK